MIDRILFKIYCMISWSSVFSPIKRLVAKWACPYNAEEHFWHDGCPVCVEVCPGCNITYVAWDDADYGGCCSPECYHYMVNTFG